MAMTHDKTTVVANVFRDELVDESAGADGNVFRKAWPLEGPLTDEELESFGFSAAKRATKDSGFYNAGQAPFQGQRVSRNY